LYLLKFKVQNLCKVLLSALKPNALPQTSKIILIITFIVSLKIKSQIKTLVVMESIRRVGISLSKTLLLSKVEDSSKIRIRINLTKIKVAREELISKPLHKWLKSNVQLLKISVWVEKQLLVKSITKDSKIHNISSTKIINNWANSSS
jgi:hypothetical protein